MAKLKKEDFDVLLKDPLSEDYERAVKVFESYDDKFSPSVVATLILAVHYERVKEVLSWLEKYLKGELQLKDLRVWGTKSTGDVFKDIENVLKRQSAVIIRERR